MPGQSPGRERSATAMSTISSSQKANRKTYGGGHEPGGASRDATRSSGPAKPTQPRKKTATRRWLRAFSRRRSLSIESGLSAEFRPGSRTLVSSILALATSARGRGPAEMPVDGRARDAEAARRERKVARRVLDGAAN